jgi:hypothetical protein
VAEPILQACIAFCEEADIGSTGPRGLSLFSLELISREQEAEPPAVSVDEQAVVLDPSEE